MLTAAQRDLIKATVPLLETGGEALTSHFYRLMLSESEAGRWAALAAAREDVNKALEGAR